MRLDVTDPAQIAAAAELAKDITLLVNNAGTQSYQRLVDGNLDAIRAELETILFGPLQLTRAFAPHLARNGDGAILNVLSAMSWFGYDGGNGYFLAKAAGWAATNGLRLELAEQKTQVTGVHIGVIDTDMSASWPGAKLDPIDVVNIALDGVEAAPPRYSSTTGAARSRPTFSWTRPRPTSASAPTWPRWTTTWSASRNPRQISRPSWRLCASWKRMRESFRSKGLTSLQLAFSILSVVSGRAGARGRCGAFRSRASG